MNYKWTENLVRECRNRDIVPFGNMSAWAKRAIMEARKTGKAEFYCESGWMAVSREVGAAFGPVATRAYRILPGWNPLAKKAGKP